MSLSQQVIKRQNNITDLQTTDENTFMVLQETLYQGATDQEVVMILNYCKAKKYDPLLKPVHLIQMQVKTDRKDEKGKYIYERKNVIMPGIASYRIDASRDGNYAGMNEPEFGEEIVETFRNDKGEQKKITYPKWCKITVKKLLRNGEIAEFTAKEYWKENYATKSKWDTSPNEVWEKRSYGQLAKCTEAQALRKAFPDSVGNDYTKEEMEGKIHFNNAKEPAIKQSILTGEIVENNIELEFVDLLQEIQDSGTIDELRTTFAKIKKINFKYKPELLKKLVDAKDSKKTELTLKEFNQEIDEATGEIIQ